MELTQRERLTLSLQNDDRLQVVPVPEGDYAVWSLEGRGTTTYTYDLASASREFLVDYGTDTGVSFTGFIE